MSIGTLCFLLTVLAIFSLLYPSLSYSAEVDHVVVAPLADLATGATQKIGCTIDTESEGSFWSLTKELRTKLFNLNRDIGGKTFRRPINIGLSLTVRTDLIPGGILASISLIFATTKVLPQKHCNTD